jgi:ketosteroid isomerase-like protein
MKTVLALTLLASVAACAEAPPPAVRPTAAVAAAERAFSARAQVVNARDAFVEHFAPDAILFAPEPSPAFPGLTEGPPWGVNIVWGPAAAGAACSGELGWTTGPAEYRRQPGGEVFRRGYYSSIWTRNADGPWKVLVDLGVGIPLDAPREADWTDAGAQPPCPPQRGDAAGFTTDLARADELLISQTTSDAVAAFGARLHPEARLHRSGVAPVLGAEAVRSALADRPKLRLTRGGLRAAASGDLGFSYGSGAWLDAAGEQRFAYLLVWERVGPDWALRLIVQDAVKPPAAAS